MYRYRLSNRRVSSDKLGPCEVCGEHASEVWLQAEVRRYPLGWTYYGCRSYFGHRECLVGEQRLGRVAFAPLGDGALAPSSAIWRLNLRTENLS